MNFEQKKHNIQELLVHSESVLRWDEIESGEEFHAYVSQTSTSIDLRLKLAVATADVFDIDFSRGLIMLYLYEDDVCSTEDNND